jgi:hypothetical protein
MHENYPIIFSRIQFTIETMSAPITAPLNEAIWNPGTTEVSSQKKAPFKIIPKIPSVRILIGRVRSEITGLITKFTNIKQAPTTNTVYDGFALIVPGST